MGNTDKFEGEQVKNPVNHIMVVFDGAADADRAIAALNGSGVNGIGRLNGREDAGKLAAATGNQGGLAKIASLGLTMGDRDETYLNQYREALERDSIVLGIEAKNEEVRDRVRSVVKENGGHGVTFFGRFATQVLEP